MRLHDITRTVGERDKRLYSDCETSVVAEQPQLDLPEITGLMKSSLGSPGRLSWLSG